jgi:serralysin
MPADAPDAFEPIIATGGPDDEVMPGGPGADSLVGGGGNDTLLGFGGDDWLFGAEVSRGFPGLSRPPSAVDGNDWIDGGAGRDTAAYHQRLDGVSVTELGAYGLVISAPLGTDRLTGVEVVTLWAPERWAGSSSIGRVRDQPVVVADGDPLFDPLWYLAGNLDIWNEFAFASDPFVFKDHPAAHFQQFGWREGRDPNPWFDTTAYLAANPDVAAAGINPLEHFRASGAAGDRDPGPDFDLRRYLALNPDVAAGGLESFAHFLEFGRGEGRDAHPAVGGRLQGGFDAQAYLMASPDVAAAGIDPLAHYLDTGWREGRDPNAFFGVAFYLAANPDVAAAGIEPLGHYARFGWREGRDPSPAFHTSGYLAAYPDVAAAGIDPLEHFLRHGYAEGRLSFGDETWA